MGLEGSQKIAIVATILTVLLVTVVYVALGLNSGDEQFVRTHSSYVLNLATPGKGKVVNGRTLYPQVMEEGDTVWTDVPPRGKIIFVNADTVVFEKVPVFLVVKDGKLEEVGSPW